MEIKDKHCICEKWRKEYLDAFNHYRGSTITKEVFTAQKRGKLCPWCGKKLVDMKRKGFILIQFPPPLIDTPDPDRNNPEYFVSLEELGRMLKGEKSEEECIEA